MSTGVSGVGVPANGRAVGRFSVDGLHAYFWSDTQRRVQTVLGLIWLLDGGLQFQSFMYSRGFVQLLASGGQGQPGWLESSVNWGARLANGDLTLWNTLFALTQVALGFGLLYRPLVKPALAASFLWVFIVWWFGEAFGMMFMVMAQPLTGAPGGVLIYGLIGLVVWPNGRPGGLLGIRGAKTMWASLWLVMAYLWLTAAGADKDETTSMINAAPSGMSWLSSVQNWVATAVKGDGLIVAIILAALSAVIAIAVAVEWRPRQFLVAAIVLNLAYWVIGQGFGGIFAGGATDPNSGPLFMLLAWAMYLVLAPPATGGAAGLPAVSTTPTEASEALG